VGQMERTFIVAVRRSRRSELPSDWVETLRRIEGVSIQGDVASPRRLVVKASMQAAERIRDAFAGVLLVEESISHTTA
jgi:hypothetical protein